MTQECSAEEPSVSSVASESFGFFATLTGKMTIKPAKCRGKDGCTFALPDQRPDPGIGAIDRR